MILEEVLARWRQQVSTLVAGCPKRARQIERICDEVTAAAGEYLVWLSEDEAMLYEGRRTPDGLRTRFAELEARGLAKFLDRKRYYRRTALRHRGNAEAAREWGRRAGRRVA